MQYRVVGLLGGPYGYDAVQMMHALDGIGAGSFLLAFIVPYILRDGNILRKIIFDGEGFWGDEKDGRGRLFRGR